MGKVLGWIEREVVAVVCAGALVLLVVMPRNASALVAVLIALVVPALVFLVRPEATVRLSRSARIVEGIVALPAVIVLGAALLAESVPVSLWGIRGQHTGAWLWVALAAVFVAFLERTREGDLVRAARAIALTGGVLAFTSFFTIHALVDKYPWLLSYGLTDSAPGLMENSISLAQVLLIALGCGGLWLFVSRGQGERVTAAFMLVLSAAGLWVTETRAALVAVAGALLAVFVLRLIWLKVRKLDARVLATLVVVVALALLAGTWLIASMEPGGVQAARWNERLSDRPGIWSAAIAVVPHRVLFGAGPDQFSAWVNWNSIPGRSMEQVSTDDPHSSLLYWLLSAGVPGLLGALAALWAVAWILAQVLERSRWRLDVSLLVCGLAAWALLTLTAWTGPLAALFVTIVVATAAGTTEAARKEEAESPKVPYVPAAIALALVAAVVVTGAPLVRSEFVWARALQSRQALSAEQQVQLAEQSGDPAYAIEAAQTYHLRIVQSRDAGMAGAALASVVPLLAKNAAWSVYAALEAVTLNADAALLGSGAGWQDVATAVDAGKKAGPTSGLWDYVGAVQLSSLGQDAQSKAYASSALDYSLPDAVRSWCEELVAR